MSKCIFEHSHWCLWSTEDTCTCLYTFKSGMLFLKVARFDWQGHSYLYHFQTSFWDFDFVFHVMIFHFRGYAKKHTVSGLDPQSEYKYRMKFMNSAGSSEYSAHVKVSTTSKCLFG